MSAAMPLNITAHSLCETLSTEALASFEHTLRTSSHTGFLKSDQTLRSVVDLDTAVLATAGVTFQQIADRLHGIIKRLIRLQNEDSDYRTHVTHKHFELEGKFSVRMVSYYRGLQDCPFEVHSRDRCDNKFSCYEFVVKNISTNKEIFFGGLLPHLYEKHEFAEGHGCYHRLDPIMAAEVLEIEPGISYSPALQDIKFWKMVDISENLSPYDLFEKEEILGHEALFSDASSDGKAKRFISHLNQDGEMTEKTFMHILACPKAKCDFPTFEETRILDSFYLDHISNYKVYSFIQQTHPIARLSEHDKIVNPDAAARSAASMHAAVGGGGAPVLAKPGAPSGGHGAETSGGASAAAERKED
jgi:uncharacterized protein YkuJ